GMVDEPQVPLGIANGEGVEVVVDQGEVEALALHQFGKRLGLVSAPPVDVNGRGKERQGNAGAEHDEKNDGQCAHGAAALLLALQRLEQNAGNTGKVSAKGPGQKQKKPRWACAGSGAFRNQVMRGSERFAFFLQEGFIPPAPPDTFRDVRGYPRAWP